MINQLIKTGLEILFPTHCFICKKQSVSLCLDCLNSRKKTVNQPYSYITSIYCFKDPYIKKIIHTIKYFHRKDLIPPLVKSCLPFFPEHRELSILVPIPMPKMRKHIRGYNQATEIAAELSKLTELKVNDDLLSRLRSPSRQVTKSSRSSRLQNQKGSFMSTSQVKGLDIILIDDVTTTGATINEARKVLIENGARSVIAFTIAH